MFLKKQTRNKKFICLFAGNNVFGLDIPHILLSFWRVIVHVNTHPGNILKAMKLETHHSSPVMFIQPRFHLAMLMRF